MTRTEFRNNNDRLSIGRVASGNVNIIARNEAYCAAATLAPKDAPAFALAVLEAAGFENTNGCAGDAVRSLKFQLDHDARVAEEAALDREAEALLEAGWAGGSKVVVWAEASEGFKKHWRAVARKARELHKAGEGKA